MIYLDEILNWSKSYTGEKFHALLCDPPYHLTAGKRASSGFMGKQWDGGDIAFRPETWAALAEHLLPGAFLIAFGGGRTYHRLACAIEDSGLILNNAIGWAFGSGFPKASRIRTGEEIETGESETLTDIRSGSMHACRDTQKTYTRSIKEAHGHQKIFEGHRYGRQAAKPALEFICLAQKPYVGKPIDSIVKTGAGAINVDIGRIPGGDKVSQRGAGGLLSHVRDGKPYPHAETSTRSNEDYRMKQSADRYDRNDEVILDKGRWPSNLVLTHSFDCKRIGVKEVKSNGHIPAIRGTGGIGTSGHSGQVGEEVKPSPEIVDDWDCTEDCPVRIMGRQSGMAGASAPVRGHEPSNATGGPRDLQFHEAHRRRTIL